jgi:hypothetical protein
METTPFDLTPEQKNVLQSLARETGKSISTLLTEALEGLQKHVRSSYGHGASNSHGDKTSVAPSPSPRPEQKPIWEVAEELFGDIPDEELAQLPTDGAAQHDHYIYGTPKRPT